MGHAVLHAQWQHPGPHGGLQAAFGFWKARDLADQGKSGEAMGQFGRIAALADLPPKRELVGIVKQAAALIDAGAKPPRGAKRQGRAG